jgi:hypothetical protein
MSSALNKPTIGERLAALFRGFLSIIKAVYEGVCKILMLVAIIVTASAVLAVAGYALYNQHKVRDVVVDWSAGRATMTLAEESEPAPSPPKGPTPGIAPAAAAVKEEVSPGVPTPKPNATPARKRAHAVVFVLDHSAASYGEQPELFQAAQQGAAKFVAGLGGDVRLSLLLLHGTTQAWAPRERGQSISPEAFKDRVLKVFPSGDLALADGLSDAIERLRADPGDGPASIVVLTAVKSDTSRRSAEDLVAIAKASGKRPVRLYLVLLGLGGTAEETGPGGALKAVASVTGGRSCDAEPQNIERKLHDLGRSLGEGDPR